MSITMDERIAALKEYVRCFPDDEEIRDLLQEHIIAKALEINPNDVLLWSDEHTVCCIDAYIELRVANAIPAMKLPKIDSYYVYAQYLRKGHSLWKIEGVDINFYYKLFVAKLMEYNPIKIAADETMFAYNLEDGKRLIRDYKGIIDDFEKMIHDDLVTKDKKKEFELYKRLKEKYEGKGNEY